VLTGRVLLVALIVAATLVAFALRRQTGEPAV
jgi:hypothetical protein